MTTFIVAKPITARPMTLGEYNIYRGWDIPADENPKDKGFLVECHSTGKSNHPDHAGQITWVPKAQFDRTHSPASAMTFGFALEALKIGKKIARMGWGGQKMWLILVPGLFDGSLKVEPQHNQALLGLKNLELHARIDAHTTDADGKVAFVTWTPSQDDMLATDWQLVA